VGSSYSKYVGTTHAAYFTSAGVVDLGTLGGFSDALAINDAGMAVGFSGGHGFLVDVAHPKMVDLNTLIPPDSGWILGGADGINDLGQITGRGYNMKGELHAYLLTPTGAGGTSGAYRAYRLFRSTVGPGYARDAGTANQRAEHVPAPSDAGATTLPLVPAQAPPAPDPSANTQVSAPATAWVSVARPSRPDAGAADPLYWSVAWSGNSEPLV
jgi:hypothetical protein